MVRRSRGDRFRFCFAQPAWLLILDNGLMVVDCAQLLYLFEVGLSNHFVQVFISESNVCAPVLADKAIDFEGVVCFVIQANAPICSGVKLLRKAQHPVELKVLTLKI